MLKYPEACLLAGTWLLVTGNIAIGYVLLVASLLFALFRFSFYIQEKKTEQNRTDDSFKKVVSTIQDLFSYYGANSGKQEKTVLH